MSRVWPNFFIVGAPKCGTTSLANWLRQHPEVFVSTPKEPHYFSTDLGNREITDADTYLSLFSKARESHVAIGEASTWYLFSNYAIRNIEHQRSDARYIVLTRDPARMAYSLYHHNVRKLEEDAPTFDEAWRRQWERRHGKTIPATCREPCYLQYYWACSLGSLVSRLLRSVPGDRVLHIRLEDIKQDPGREYRRVVQFLGVSYDGRRNFPVANESTAYRNRILQRLLRFGGDVRRKLGVRRGLGLSRLNERLSDKRGMSPQMERELIEYFSGERWLLERLAAGPTGRRMLRQ